MVPFRFKLGSKQDLNYAWLTSRDQARAAAFLGMRVLLIANCVSCYNTGYFGMEFEYPFNFLEPTQTSLNFTVLEVALCLTS